MIHLPVSAGDDQAVNGEACEVEGTESASSAVQPRHRVWAKITVKISSLSFATR